MFRDRMGSRLSMLIGCLAIVAFGVAAFVIALGYDMGSVRRMGPGFFPVITCVAIILLATATAVETLFESPRKTAIKVRPVVFVSLSVIAWVLTIDSIGLVPSTFAVICISAFARPPFRPIPILIVSVALSVAGYLIFIVGLSMPLTLFGR